MEYQPRFIEKYISAVQCVWSFEEEHWWKLAKVNYQDSPKLLKTLWPKPAKHGKSFRSVFPNTISDGFNHLKFCSFFFLQFTANIL